MTKLIALVALAAAATSLQSDIAEGQPFEIPADEAELLLTQGSAQLADPPLAPQASPVAPKSKLVAARVLVDGPHGLANTVAMIDPAEVKALEAAGQVDGGKAAVAYARSL